MEEDKYLVWLDMEMTGLNVETDRVLELAIIVTDMQLNEIHERLELVLTQPTALLESMDLWCKTHHSDSGLVAKVHLSRNTEAIVLTSSFPQY